MTLNEKMRAAVSKVNGLGDFYYNDPATVTANGKKVNYPAVFRLLRTDDTIVTEQYKDTVTQGEVFAFIKTVDRSPGGDYDEAAENELTRLAFEFFAKLKVEGVDFTLNPQLRWARRDSPSYGIVLIVRANIPNCATITAGCVSQKYLPDELPTDEC